MEGYGLWYNPMLSWQKIFCFREWKDFISFISLFLVNSFQFWTIPPVFCSWELDLLAPTFNGIKVYWQNMFEKCCIRKQPRKKIVGLLEMNLWGFFRIKSAASSCLRMKTENLDFGAFSLPGVRSHQAGISHGVEMEKYGLLLHFLSMTCPLAASLWALFPLSVSHHLGSGSFLELCSALEQSPAHVSFHLLNSYCKYRSHLSKPLFRKRRVMAEAGL